MIRIERVRRAVVEAALAGLMMAATGALCLSAQQAGVQAAHQPASQPRNLASIPLPEASAVALPLAEDRGAAALEQSLKRLSTTASVMMIVAHPDDEDGALLTYLSRGLGVRTILLTLNRGEGGQNVMSADLDDALGLIRTNELLRADEYYGAKQLWGTEVDFGFSKTQEESFAKWGHERVLYDAVLAVRRERPQIIVSTFVGGVSDGHGHHQVSGEIAQEVFKAAGDPKVFPEQLKDGLQPWQPLAVYSMVPFAPIENGKMFDYATGKWAPARFKNYVTGEWTEGALSTDVTLPVGTLDPVLGRSYVQIARQGWGEQKSQNGGANPALSGPATTRYHLWAVAPQAAAKPGASSRNDDLFHNSTVNIVTSIAGLAALVKDNPPDWLTIALQQIDADLTKTLGAPGPDSGIWDVAFTVAHPGQNELACAHNLAPVYRATLDLRARIGASNLDAQAKSALFFHLDAKINDFQSALKNLLGLDLIAFTTHAEKIEDAGSRGSSADETPRSVSLGEQFNVRVHISSRLPKAYEQCILTFKSPNGEIWWRLGLSKNAVPTSFDEIFRFRVPDGVTTTANQPHVLVYSGPSRIPVAGIAQPTQPYFIRPTIEQPYYDLTRPEYRLRSFEPFPLAAWAEFTFDGLPIRVGQVVQTMERVQGLGGVYEPLAVTPAIGVRMEPEARILPLDGSTLPVKVTVHTEAAVEGTVTLELPAGWTAQPAEAKFHRDSAGDTEPLLFSVTTDGATTGAYDIKAVAHSGGHDYTTGWQSVGYAGLRPYNFYKSAELKTRKVDVKLAPGLRIGYVMGTGDLVPQAIEAMGVAPHLLTPAELTSGDLSQWNVIVIGIRAYSARPELAQAQPRLDEFVLRGGTLIVQYQSGDFPAPFPLSMGRMAERVVDETAPVKLLEPSNPLFNSPNKITAADFDGWVEERGHSFLYSWDASYTPLTETADPGQDPQRGGLLVAHPGKGTYIYVAYALYRQLPELVPGAYRLLGNLLSAR